MVTITGKAFVIFMKVTNENDLFSETLLRVF